MLVQAPIPGASALPVQPAAEQKEVEMEMGPAVIIMKPILRFLQLLCENHNQDLQVRFCSIAVCSQSVLH